MLTKKDKEWIKNELKAALVREITVEKGKRRPEDPEKSFETQKVSVLDFMVKYLPYVEGAIRGTQEDVDNLKNAASASNKKIDALARVLIDFESTVKKLAGFIELLESNGVQLTKNESKLIEHESDS